MKCITKGCNNECQEHSNYCLTCRQTSEGFYGSVYKLQKQHTQLLTALKRAVKVSEDLHDDYEYCREWREVLDLMRKTIKECE